MFVITNASITPWENTGFQGSKINFAEQSLGCQFTKAAANFCRIGAYRVSNLAPSKEIMLMTFSTSE